LTTFIVRAVRVASLDDVGELSNSDVEGDELRKEIRTAGLKSHSFLKHVRSALIVGGGRELTSRRTFSLSTSSTTKR
jgi:hypothetical protein